MQVLSLYKYLHITPCPIYRHFTSTAARGRLQGLYGCHFPKLCRRCIR